MKILLITLLLLINSNWVDSQISSPCLINEPCQGKGRQFSMWDSTCTVVELPQNDDIMIGTYTQSHDDKKFCCIQIDWELGFSIRRKYDCYTRLITGTDDKLISDIKWNANIILSNEPQCVPESICSASGQISKGCSDDYRCISGIYSCCVSKPPVYTEISDGTKTSILIIGSIMTRYLMEKYIDPAMIFAATMGQKNGQFANYPIGTSSYHYHGSICNSVLWGFSG